MAEKINLDIDETVKKYFKDLKEYKPLSKSKEQNLLRTYHNEGNLMARDLLIKSNLKYACSMANTYRGKGVALSELISEANSGLMEAIDKFDLSKDVKVITYAKWWIMQRLNNCINNNGKFKTDELPTDHEKQNGNDDDYEVVSDEFIIEDDIDYEKNENIKKEYINTLLSCLNQREYDIISLYYGLNGDNHTLEEIGEHYNLTKERIRQIIENSLTKVRTEALMSMH